MEKKIEEMNKIIAEFDGWTLIPVSDNGFVSAHYERGHDWMDAIEDFKYHSSWDALMPVVEKIKHMQHNPSEMFMGTTLERRIAFTSVTSLPIYTPIQTVWNKVSDFIRWYNDQVEMRNTNTSTIKP